MEHVEWARSIARHVSRLLPTWFTEDDLIGPVELALVHLAASYDPARGVPFKAYAQRRIYGACIDSIRRREYKERGHQSIEGLDKVCVMPSPEEQAAKQELRRVWDRVQQLPRRHCLVILGVYGGHMTLEELSTKVDVGAARLSQIHREALGMLRETCEELKAA